METCQPLLLVLRLLFLVEGVKRPGWAVWEKRREFLGFQLLLDAVKLAAAGGHCGRKPKQKTKNSALLCRHHTEAATERARTDLASPLPRHPPLTRGAGLVEVTGSTRGLVNHS